MGKTHAQRMKVRDERLSTMPRKARYAESAKIKKKEGRVLDANEKRAVKMQGSHGAIMRAWEVLRASADKVDEKIEAMRQQAKQQGALDATEKHALAKSDIDAATGNRQQAVAKVLALIKPKFEEVARTPTVSRVIQSCIKFGTAEQRSQILLMFTPKFTDFCTDSFGHFAIEALIRHALKADFKALYGLTVNVLNVLVTHKCGIRIINALYNHKLCSTSDKHVLVLGVFKDSVAVMKGWSGYPVLEDILAHEGDHRRRLLNVLFDVSDKLISQKQAFDFPFVQRLLCALFARGTKEQVEELAATVKTHIVAMAQTRDGARLASIALAVLQPRARKAVLQDLVQHFETLATDKYSPMFLCRCFDLTYDPQMAHKFLVAPMVASIGPISGSPFGYRILLHLLTPDAERKSKVLLPGFEDHNVYSRANRTWNHHTWRTDTTLEEETVQICPKPAEDSHLNVIGPIVQAFVETVCKVKGLAENKTLKAFVARIAAEIAHLQVAEPAYKKAMGLSKEQLEVINSVKSNKDKEKLTDGGNATAASSSSAAAVGSSTDASPARRSKTVTGTPAGKEATPARKSAAKVDVTPVAEERVSGRKSAKSAAGGASPSVAPTPPPRKSSRAETAAAAAAADDDDELVEESAAMAPPGLDDDDAVASPARGSARRSAKRLVSEAAASPKAARKSAAGSVTPQPRASAGKKASTPSSATRRPSAGNASKASPRSSALHKL